jgi:hypothetical protein
MAGAKLCHATLTRVTDVTLSKFVFRFRFRLRADADARVLMIAVIPLTLERPGHGLSAWPGYNIHCPGRYTHAL